MKKEEVREVLMSLYGRMSNGDSPKEREKAALLYMCSNVVFEEIIGDDEKREEFASAVRSGGDAVERLVFGIIENECVCKRL